MRIGLLLFRYRRTAKSVFLNVVRRLLLLRSFDERQSRTIILIRDVGLLVRVQCFVIRYDFRDPREGQGELRRSMAHRVTLVAE